MGFYTEATAEKAIEDIKSIIGNIAIVIDYEIQDDGEFLLVNVDFAKRPEEAQVQTWYTALKEHFSKIFTKPKEGYSWMINIMHNRYILDSVMDEIASSA